MVPINLLTIKLILCALLYVLMCFQQRCIFLIPLKTFSKWKPLGWHTRIRCHFPDACLLAAERTSKWIKHIHLGLCWAGRVGRKVVGRVLFNTCETVWTSPLPFSSPYRLGTCNDLRSLLIEDLWCQVVRSWKQVTPWTFSDTIF